MNRATRALNGTLMSFFQYGLQIMMQVILSPIILKAAGQDALGAYAILTQVIGYLALLDVGFTVTINRYLSQAFGAEDEGLYFSKILSSGRYFLLITNLFISISCIFLSFFIGSLFNLTGLLEQQVRLSLILLAAWSILRIPTVIYTSALTGIQDLAARSFILSIATFVRLLLSVLFVLYGWGVLGLILSYIIADCFDVFISRFRFKYKRPGLIVKWQWQEPKFMREIFWFGLQAMLINFAARLIFYTDNLVVGWLYGVAAVSIYYSTQMPAMVGWIVITRVTDNATPAMNEIYFRNEMIKLKDIYLRVYRYILLLVLPFAVGLIVLQRSFTILWVGEAQYGGLGMTILLAIFAVIVCINHLGTSLVLVFGKLNKFTWISVLEGFINLVLSIIFGYRFGLSGVVLGSVVASLITFTYVNVFVVQESYISLKLTVTNSIIPSMPPVLISGLALIVLKIYWFELTWLSLICISLFYVTVQLISSWIFALKSDERLFLRQRLSLLSRNFVN